MRNGILNKPVLAVIILLTFAGCKAHKQLVIKRAPVTVSPAKPVENAMTKKLDAIRARQLSFNTFSGKAKTKLDINGKGNDVTLNVRIAHNKKIWVSVTAIFGVEVARALITPDSIMVINRLQGVYLQKPFSYVYQFAPTQINYLTVESLLIGNAIPELIKNDADVSAQGANTLISGNLQNLLYKLIIGPDFKVNQTSLENRQAAQSLQATNSTFIQAGNRIIPSHIDIASVAGNQKVNISLQYNNAEFDQPLEYPFSVPGRYSRID